MAEERRGLTFEEKINLAHCAVVVVDVQNIFCRGPLQDVTGVVIEPIRDFLKKARECSVAVIFIQQLTKKQTRNWDILKRFLAFFLMLCHEIEYFILIAVR